MKYTNEFKLKVVREYFTGNYSYTALCKKYQIPSRSSIRNWVVTCRTRGYKSILRKRRCKNYPVKFKLKVADFYLNHQFSQVNVANRFDINPSQVHSWYCKYQKEGIDGLQSKHRRLSRVTMSK